MPVAGPPAKLGAAAAIVLAALCGLVAINFWASSPARTALTSLVGERGEGAAFDWADERNANMFAQACQEGNTAACVELAGHQEALDALNRRATADAQLSARRGRVASSRIDADGEADGDVQLRPLYSTWDRTVPLDAQYEIRELQRGDLGSTLVPAEDVAFMHDKDAVVHEAHPQGARKAFRGQELVSAPLPVRWARQGLQLLVPGGREQQQRVQNLVVDLCGPDGPYCGPTRPAEDHGADVVLTEPDEFGGWLNTKYECCPCLGRGKTRIGYDQFDHNGYYNPYTMNLCRPCGRC